MFKISDIKLRENISSHSSQGRLGSAPQEQIKPTFLETLDKTVQTLNAANIQETIWYQVLTSCYEGMN